MTVAPGSVGGATALQAREARTQAVAALCAEVGLAAGEAQVAAMVDYLALLERWNRTHNLTAVRDPQSMLTHHLADCLAAVAALERHPCGATARRILDVGSGGGLPGLLLALFSPGSTVTCVDAVAKKAAFIRQAAGQLGLTNVEVRHGRVEQLAARHTAPFDLITARAVSTLADLVRWTRGLIGDSGCWMAMKGQVPEAEMSQLPAGIDVFHVEQLAVPGLDAQRCLVWMRRRRDS